MKVENLASKLHEITKFIKKNKLKLSSHISRIV